MDISKELWENIIKENRELKREIKIKEVIMEIMYKDLKRKYELLKRKEVKNEYNR